jgi:hypothetical protein
MTSPSQRHPSRKVRIALAVMAGLFLAFLALWLVRVPVAEWAIEGAADDAGLGPAEVEVSRMGLSGAAFSLSRSAAGSIDRVEMDYRLFRLLVGSVDRVRVEGADLRFTWKDGALSPRIGGDGGPLILPVSRVEIAGSSITVTTANGPVTAQLDGVLLGDAGLSADLGISVLAPQGRIVGRIAGTAQPDGTVAGTFALTSGDLSIGSVTANGLSGALRVSATEDGSQSIDGSFSFQEIASGATPLGSGRLNASLLQPGNVLALSLDSTPLQMKLRADGAEPAKGVPFEVEGTAAANFLGSLAGATDPAEGHIRFEATGTSPPTAGLDKVTQLGLGDWLRHGTMNGDLSGSVRSLNIPDGLGLADAELAMRLALADGRLTLTAPRTLTITGLELADAVADPDSLLSHPTSLRVSPEADRALLSIVPSENGHTALLAMGLALKSSDLELEGTWRGEASLQAGHWSASAKDAAATGTFSISGETALSMGEDLSASAAGLIMSGSYHTDGAVNRLEAERAILTLQGAKAGAGIASAEPLRLALKPGARLVEDRTTGSMTVKGDISPFRWTLSLPEEEPAPEETADGKADSSPAGEPDAPPTLLLAARNGVIDVDETGARLRLERASLGLPDSGIAADGVTLAVVRTQGRTDARLAIADLHSTAEPALFPSLRSRVHARLTGGDANFTISLDSPEETISFAGEGNHDLDTGRGSAAFTLQPIDLSSKGVLEKLSPLLAARVSAGTGTVSGSGAIHWGDGAPPGTLSLNFKDVGLKSDTFSMSSLNGQVRLESLLPVATSPGQHLTATFDVPAVGKVPLNAKFRLDPDQLVLEHVTADLFGGTFETKDAVFDAVTGNGSMNLQIAEMNLETALAVIDLEELKGTGRIGGTLPLRVEDGRISVDAGKLQSAGPGVVKVDVGAVSDQLSAYGENVDLAFRALKDFHYDTLTIEADKSFAGTGKALFHLEGNNPAVMEGQPFVFNITLETDFDYLTGLLTQLSGVANRALGWGVRELENR